MIYEPVLAKNARNLKAKERRIICIIGIPTESRLALKEITEVTPSRRVLASSWTSDVVSSLGCNSIQNQ